MSQQPLKLLFLLIAAAFEVSILHLGAALLAVSSTGAVNVSWFILLLVALVSALTTARFESVDAPSHGRATPTTLLVAALVVGYAAKLQAHGGAGLLTGWTALWPFGAVDANVRGLSGPTILLVCLAAWWRGMVLLDHDHASLLASLQRGILGIVVLALLLTPFSLVNLGAPPWGVLLATEAVLTVGLGLIGLSLARVVGDAERRAGSNSWHWLRSGIATTGLILLGGTLLLALVSDTATFAVRALLGLIGGVVALIFSPVLVLMTALAEWLRGDGSGLPLPTPSATASGAAEPPPLAADQTTPDLVTALLWLLTLALYLLPIAALIVLIVFMRRRRHSDDDGNGEVHESLWSWQGLRADMAELLGALRRSPRPHGLRDALDRLRADDPVQRVRRRYVQLLLLGEAADHGRKPQQTPREYEGELRPHVNAAELHNLTAVYDRARYAPDTIDDADAARADAAWIAIETRANKENP